MIRWLKLTERNLERHRKHLLLFFRKHGDKRITKAGMDWLRQAGKEDVNREGNFMIYGLHNKLLVGVFIVVNYGIDESFIAVHRHYRNQDIGSEMIQRAITELGKLYGRVAMDNIPSLNLCFHNGMVAFQYLRGPTGKPTLWLGGGQWKREDVRSADGP